MEVTINEAAWQYALDKANTEALASLPEKEKRNFSPIKLEDYVQKRINDLNDSYGQQQVQDLANDPVVSARILKILSSSKEVRDKFSEQVDALP